MPLTSSCICGNAAAKFVYMRQCRWQVHVYAAMPLTSSCICGNAAGKRQLRGQSHVYAAMPLVNGNAAGKSMYTRQSRFPAKMRCRINIIAHAMESTLSRTRSCTGMILASKSHLQASNSPSRWQRCHSTQEQSSHILSSLSPAIFQPLRMLFWHPLPP